MIDRLCRYRPGRRVILEHMINANVMDYTERTLDESAHNCVAGKPRRW
jgi:hypothetical protein